MIITAISELLREVSDVVFMSDAVDVISLLVMFESPNIVDTILIAVKFESPSNVVIISLADILETPEIVAMISLVLNFESSNTNK